jgi:purine-binding chemotaxis protein CheW
VSEAQGGANHPQGPALRHVIFRAADQRFGLPLAAAGQVVPPPRQYTRIPRSPPEALGVMNVRGRIVTVVDFARLLALPRTVEAGMPRVIVLEARKRDLGLLVDEVVGIEVLERERAVAGGPPMCVGIARLDGEPVTLLGADALIAALVQAFNSPARSVS